MRLNHIITDFLNFARPREPNFVECRIPDILNKNVSYLSSLTADKGCRIDLIGTTDVAPILADPDMLYQAFLNVLLNAVQSMPNGGALTVSVETENSTGFRTTSLKKSGNPFSPPKRMEPDWGSASCGTSSECMMAMWSSPMLKAVAPA